jgi:hypothetical protein
MISKKLLLVFLIGLLAGCSIKIGSINLQSEGKTTSKISDRKEVNTKTDAKVPLLE